MHHFVYKDGRLFCEDTALEDIADRFGTPVYVYSATTLERHYKVFEEAFAPRKVHIAFAMKANSNVAVLRTLARLGAGADTVSAGEVRRALAAGIPGAKIVLSGVGKTRDELEFALENDVGQINIESEPEMDLLEQVAIDTGRKQAIATRVNPDVGAGGHAKITTGKSENKFGVSFETAARLYARAHKSAHLEPIGVACHIGSQITDLAPMDAAFRRMTAFAKELRAGGLPLRVLDLGGGLGVPYEGQAEPPSPKAYADMVVNAIGDLDVELAFEPGRLIAGNAGVLLSRTIYVKQGDGRKFLILDAAMNDLLRPALYDAFHDIWPVAQAAPGAAQEIYDVVGPICETGDTFATGRELPAAKPGDLFAFMTAGAYGATMSSTYNSRELAPEVMVKGDQVALTKRRMTVEDQLALEFMPDWLTNS